MNLVNNRFFKSRFWRLLALCLMVITVGALINLYGIYVLGGLENWQEWRAESYEYFLAWRLAVYAFIVRGWLPIRKRLMEREPEHSWRLKRAELAAGTATFLFEVSRAQAYGLWGSA